MAIALEGPNQVWQRVNNMLQGASPEAKAAFKSLKQWLSTQKGNPKLQLVQFAAEDIVTNLGYSPDVDAALIYGVYMKGRRTSGTTAAFAAIHDATDNSATTTTVLTQKFNLTGQEFVAINPVGFRLTTELTVSCATAVGGATESSAADACDGFVIIAG
jgi:hypothetical protein